MNDINEFEWWTDKFSFDIRYRAELYLSHLTKMEYFHRQICQQDRDSFIIFFKSRAKERTFWLHDDHYASWFDIFLLDSYSFLWIFFWEIIIFLFRVITKFILIYELFKFEEKKMNKKKIFIWKRVSSTRLTR